MYVFLCLDVILVLWLFFLRCVCLFCLFYFFLFFFFSFLLFCFIIIFSHDFREIGRKNVGLGRWANAEKLLGFGGGESVIRIYSIKRKHILNKKINFKASLSIFKKLIYCMHLLIYGEMLVSVWRSKTIFSLNYEGPGDWIQVSVFVTHVLPAKSFWKHEKYFYIIKKKQLNNTDSFSHPIKEWGY